MKKPQQPSAWPCAKTGGKDAGPPSRTRKVTSVRPETLLTYRFEDGSEIKMALVERELQGLLEAAAASQSDDADLREMGKRFLADFAVLVAQARLQPYQAKWNASKPRVVSETDRVRIVAEFKRRQQSGNKRGAITDLENDFEYSAKTIRSILSKAGLK